MIVAAVSSQVARSLQSTESIPASALSIGNGTPMTPVDATNTSDGWQPSALETRAVIAPTPARPRFQVQAMDFPAFSTTAFPRPRRTPVPTQFTSGPGLSAL